MTTGVAVQDKTITLNGLRFHYRDWGHEGAQALVLLHGFTGHARSWDSFARPMQEKYRVLALDQRGHGESEWAQDYAADRMVEDVDAFVRELGLAPFALLGLSMGGRNAYAYAALHPQAVQKLVIVDIGPEIATAGATRIFDSVQAPDQFDDIDQAYALSRAANPRPPEAELRHRVSNNLMQQADGRWTWRYDKSLRSPGAPLPRPDPEEAWASLSKITAPTLLVRGAESDILAIETAERMVREIPNCRMVEVPDAGHSVPLDNPTGFLEAVQQFL